MTGMYLVSKRGLLLLMFVATLLLLCTILGQAAADDGEMEVGFRVKGQYQTQDNLMDIVVDGDLAYCINDDSDLIILNISDPANPRFLGKYYGDGSLEGIAVNGTYVYLANYDYGLDIINVTDPAKPQLEGRNETVAPAKDIAFDGEHIYIADRNEGLAILNVSDPANPSILGEYYVDGVTLSVAVNGDHAYLGGYDENIRILNVSDPENPELDELHKIYSWPNHMVSNGEILFVSAQGMGLVIVDVGDPSNPRTLGVYSLDQYPYRAYVTGDTAFLPIGSHGILTLDLEHFTNPILIGHYDVYARSVVMNGDHLHLAADNSGLIALDVTPVAWIDFITVTLPTEPDDTTIEVEFSGYGSCIEERSIVRYEWRSSRDGILYNDTGTGNFDADNLSLGKHEISLRVRDDRGIWSDETTKNIIVTLPPVAFLDSISPDPGYFEKEILFTGHGTDDGTVVAYEWRSSLDGRFYNGTDASISYSDLSLGKHTISFRVMDNYGVWSEEINTPLLVKPEPKPFEYDKDEPDNEDTKLAFRYLGIIFMAVGGLGFLLKVRKGRMKKADRAKGIDGKERKGTVSEPLDPRTDESSDPQYLPDLSPEENLERLVRMPVSAGKEDSRGMMVILGFLLVIGMIFVASTSFSIEEDDPVKIRDAWFEGDGYNPDMVVTLINIEDRNISTSDLRYKLYGVPMSSSKSGKVSENVIDANVNTIALNQTVNFVIRNLDLKGSFDLPAGERVVVFLEIYYKGDLSHSKEISMDSYYYSLPW